MYQDSKSAIVADYGSAFSNSWFIIGLLIYNA